MLSNTVECLATPKFAQNHGEAADAQTVITITGDADHFWVLDWLVWSYSHVPTGGRLTVTIGGTTYLDIDITSAGPGPLRFDLPLYNPAFTKGEDVVISLAAGGGSCVGKLSVRYR